MIHPLIRATVKGLRDLRPHPCTVETDIVPNGSGRYPLDLSPVGRQFSPGSDGIVRVAGPDGLDYGNPVSACLFALATHTRALGTTKQPDARLAAFLAQASHLRRSQDANGGWRYPIPVARYRVAPGWYSGMAQGLAVSVLLRAGDLTGEPSYLDAARAAVALLLKPLADGGCAHYDEVGRPFLEECPSDPPSHILNGALFALIGLREFEARSGGDAHVPAARRLAAQLGRYDLGYWSRYDLCFDAPATMAYHSLHISLLEAAAAVLAAPSLRGVALVWRSYLRNPYHRLRAAAGKARFVLREEGSV